MRSVAVCVGCLPLIRLPFSSCYDPVVPQLSYRYCSFPQSRCLSSFKPPALSWASRPVQRLLALSQSFIIMSPPRLAMWLGSNPRRSHSFVHAHRCTMLHHYRSFGFRVACNLGSHTFRPVLIFVRPPAFGVECVRRPCCQTLMHLTMPSLRV